MIKLTFYCSLFFLLFSCKNELEPKDYVAWIKDKNNGLVFEQSNFDFKTILQYCPADYMALISANGSNNFEKEFENRKPDFSNSYNYTLKLVNEKSENLLTYKLKNKDEEFLRIKYFSEEIQNDLFIITSTDTISCALCHFERTYNTSPGITLNINFEKSEAKEFPQKLIWLDRVFTNKIIAFSIKDIFNKDLPTVKL